MSLFFWFCCFFPCLGCFCWFVVFLLVLSLVFSNKVVVYPLLLKKSLTLLKKEWYWYSDIWHLLEYSYKLQSHKELLSKIGLYDWDKVYFIGHVEDTKLWRHHLMYNSLYLLNDCNQKEIRYLCVTLNIWKSISWHVNCKI